MTPAAGIVLDDGTQALWFVELSLPKSEGDFMGVIDRTPDGRLKLTYRIRWYRDDKIWDSKDRKNWFTGYSRHGDDVAASIEGMREIIEDLKRRTGAVGKVYEILRGNLSTRDFTDLIIHQEFAHTKHLTEPEYAAMQRPGSGT